jgi:hypothetical protein
VNRHYLGLRGVDTSGRERRWEKGVRGQIWYKCCIHMNVNGKKILDETISQMQGVEDKGE